MKPSNAKEVKPVDYNF